jgi:hypothetical protein
MRRRIFFLFVCFAISGTTLGQRLFPDCSKNLYRQSKPESWQRDTIQCRTFMRNCYSSITYLVLYNDSTFQYKVDRCGTGGYAGGKWKMNSRKRIELFDSRTSERKLISIHGPDLSMTYIIENVDNEIFRTDGTDMIKVSR